MAEEVQMTAEGYRRLQETLEKERQRRDDVIAQLAATRDEALNIEDRNLETSGQIDLPSVEARILELEDVLTRAVIVEAPQGAGRVALGSVVVLHDEEHDREMQVRLVSAVEVDALAGGPTQVSEDSPVGKALLGRGEGESFEVEVGPGQARYTVRSIGGE